MSYKQFQRREWKCQASVNQRGMIIHRKIKKEQQEQTRPERQERRSRSDVPTSTETRESDHVRPFGFTPHNSKPPANTPPSKFDQPVRTECNAISDNKDPGNRNRRRNNNQDVFGSSNRKVVESLDSLFELSNKPMPDSRRRESREFHERDKDQIMRRGRGRYIGRGGRGGRARRNGHKNDGDNDDNVKQDVDGSDDESNSISNDNRLSGSLSHLHRGRGRQRGGRSRGRGARSGTTDSQREDISSTKEEDDNIDENEVFKFLVTECKGITAYDDFIKRCQLFPDGFDASEWFRRHSRRFRLIAKNQEIMYVLPFYDVATICLDHNRMFFNSQGCRRENCKHFHICKRFVAGHCRFGIRCIYSHDFGSKFNQEQKKRLGLDDVFTDEDLRIILRDRYPMICPDYFGVDSCDRGDTCPYLHLCKKFVAGKCSKENCVYSHDMKTDHNKRSLGERWADCVMQGKEGFVKKIILMGGPRKQRDHREEVKENKDDLKGKDNDNGANGREEKSVMENESGVACFPHKIINIPVTSVTTKAELTTEETKDGSLMKDDADNKPICVDYIGGTCHQCDTGHHPVDTLPYLWQIKKDKWVCLTSQRNQDVEEKYCNKQQVINTKIQVEDTTFAVRICHDEQRNLKAVVYACIGTVIEKSQSFPARRLSTESHANETASKAFYTQWRWYWKDDTGTWVPYDSDGFQKTLENKYMFGQTSYWFTRLDYRFKYRIDFTKFKQVNLDTGKEREIIRRPLFVSPSDVVNRKYPETLSITPIPPEPGFSPWDMTSEFELVELNPGTNEFKDVKSHFGRTMDADRFKVAIIYRVQNRKLLNEYKTKKQNMVDDIKQEGDKRDVAEMKLFHGTDNIDICRAICTNNFDFRTSGKNATMYGEGSYFAVDAKYSHSYTKQGPDGQRYIFRAKVLAGLSTNGHSSYRRPPLRPGKAHKLYDSCVDDENRPNIYVIFDRGQCYPEYLIAYGEEYNYAPQQPSHIVQVPTGHPSNRNRYNTTTSIATSSGQANQSFSSRLRGSNKDSCVIQ